MKTLTVGELRQALNNIPNHLLVTLDLNLPLKSAPGVIDCGPNYPDDYAYIIGARHAQESSIANECFELKIGDTFGY